MDVYNFSQQKSDEEILKEILAKHNLSISDFTVYHITSKIPSYFDQPALWYMIEDNKVKMLRISSEIITHIDLSGLPNLEYLDLVNCNITDLKLSNLPNLKELDLNENKALSRVDLSGLTNLESLYLEDCENLNEVILSKKVKSKINIIGNLYKLNIIWK